MGAPFGNADKQSADPSFYFPPKPFGRYSQDSAVYLASSVLANTIMALLFILISLILIIYYKQNPKVQTQDKGVLFYRTTSEFKPRTNIFRVFVRFTTETLLTITQKEYDLSPLKPFVAPDIIDAFTESAQAQRKNIKQSNRSQYFEVGNIARYNNPDLPQYLGLAVQGRKIYHDPYVTRLRTVDIRETIVPTLLIIYLDQIPITTKNPWGWELVGIQEEVNPKEANLIWDSCTSLTETEDLKEKIIIPPRKEYLPLPLFEKEQPYQWFSDGKK